MKHATPYTREIVTLEPNLDIGFAEVTPNMVHPYMPFHWHDCYELLYIINGTGTLHKMSHSSQTYTTGNIVCTEPFEIHAINMSSDTHFILAMIPTTFIQKYIPDLEKIRFELPISSSSPIINTKLELLRKAFYDMLIAETFKERGYSLRFQSILFELLYQMYHNFSITVSDGKKEKYSQNYRRLQTIVAFVHENYHRQISIEEISGTLHLQPQYFCHYFKKNFGQSFLSYIYEICLYHIEADLLQTDLPISFIAEKHGFISLDLFRKKFFQKNNCTPTAFRKQHK